MREGLRRRCEFVRIILFSKSFPLSPPFSPPLSLYFSHTHAHRLRHAFIHVYNIIIYVCVRVYNVLARTCRTYAYSLPVENVRRRRRRRGRSAAGKSDNTKYNHLTHFRQYRAFSRRGPRMEIVRAPHASSSARTHARLTAAAEQGFIICDTKRTWLQLV